MVVAVVGDLVETVIISFPWGPHRQLWRVCGASGCHRCRCRCRSSIWILQVSDDVAVLVPAEELALVTLLFLLNLELVHFLNTCFWWFLWWHWRLALGWCLALSLGLS